MNTVNYSIYIPLLKQFCDEGGLDLIKKCGYDQGPFIPYTFSRYSSAPIKVIYMGIDTYYWVPIKTLNKAFSSNDLESYMQANVTAMTRDDIFKWKNATSFWGVVARLHLMLRTGRYYDDICHLSDQEKLLLDEIGYSNIFSIEKWDTINGEKKRNLGLEDRDTYNRLVKMSSPLSDFKTMLSAYRPDIVFLFSWQDYDLGDLDLEENKDEYEDKYRAVFDIPAMGCKLIWTTHPSSFSYKSTNMQEMVPYLYQTAIRVCNF